VKKLVGGETEKGLEKRKLRQRKTVSDHEEGYKHGGENLVFYMSMRTNFCHRWTQRTRRLGEQGNP